MDPLIPAIISTVINTILSTPADPPPVDALARPIPAEAARAQMQPPVNGRVELDGKSLPLSPGAQIRDTNNRIVMPLSVQHPTTVRYLTDAGGAVHRVWILTPAEVAQPVAR